MENVGVAVATSAWLLASADGREQGAKLVASAASRADAEATEAKVIAAWLEWYGEALDNVLTLPDGGADAALRERVAEAKGRLR